jgi:hypothetical protein
MSLFQMPKNNGTALGYDDNQLSEFTALSTKFDSCHQDLSNILMHAITTPIGILGFLGLFRYLTRSTTATSVLCLVYLMKLVASVPIGVFLGTFLILSLCLFLVYRTRMGLFSSVALIAFGYVAQDLAHIISNEVTYQASYSAGGHVRTSSLTKFHNLIS